MPTASYSAQTAPEEMDMPRYTPEQVRIVVADIAQEWMSTLRQRHGGLPVPPMDWRFSLLLPDGTEVGMPYDATATDIAFEMARQGIWPIGVKQ